MGLDFQDPWWKMLSVDSFSLKRSNVTDLLTVWPQSRQYRKFSYIPPPPLSVYPGAIWLWFLIHIKLEVFFPSLCECQKLKLECFSLESFLCSELQCITHIFPLGRGTQVVDALLLPLPQEKRWISGNHERGTLRRGNGSGICALAGVQRYCLLALVVHWHTAWLHFNRG